MAMDCSPIEMAALSNGTLGGGNSWWWVIILFLFFGWGGNGFGFNRNNGQFSPLAADVGAMMTQNAAETNASLQGIGQTVNALNTKLCCLENATNQGFNSVIQNSMQQATALNTNLMQGFNGVDKALCCMGNSLSQSLNTIGYNMQSGLCTLAQAIQNDGNATRALINDINGERLRGELSAAKATIAQYQTINGVVSALRPCAPCPVTPAV